MNHTGSAIICSDTSRRLRAVDAAAERLGKRFEIVVISLAPDADTPEGWTSSLRSIQRPDAAWHFLEPTPADAIALAGRPGVKHWRQNGFLLHEVRILHLDSRGRVVRTLDGYDRDAERLLKD